MQEAKKRYEAKQLNQDKQANKGPFSHKSTTMLIKSTLHGEKNT